MFQKAWKNEIENSWLQSCLINISGRPNKSISDDWFDKTMIMLNKQNINPFANIKSDEFLQEIISQNVLSLYKSKEILL